MGQLGVDVQKDEHIRLSALSPRVELNTSSFDRFEHGQAKRPFGAFYETGGGPMIPIDYDNLRTGNAAQPGQMPKDHQYITPHSESILPSITNNSLIVLAQEMGLNPQRRPIPIEEIFDFEEAGCCGTAAVVTPVGSITYGDRKAVYCDDGTPGRYCTELYEKLIAIQVGDAPDRHDWLHRIPVD